MPRIARSPPKTPAVTLSPSLPSLLPPLTHCKSDSNLVDSPTAATAVPNLLRDASSDPNITIRKRKRDDISREEFMEMFSSLKKEQEERFTALMSKVQEGIQTNTEQNKSIQGSIEFLGQKYDELLTRVDTLERERTSDRKYIQSLEDRLEQLDRNLRSSSIEVRNLPKKTGESKEDLLNLVKKVGTALNVQLQPVDVRDVYRINTKNETNQPIVAELSSVFLKEKIIGNVKMYNKSYATNKFNTSNLQLVGPTIPIYISESLAPHTKKLFYLAREFAKEHTFRYCWASRGRIYLRRADGAPLVRVNNESDLDNIAKNK